MSTPGAATRTGRVIGGRYAVLGELGRGGMGVVWRAEDTVLGRRVAVKELHLLDGLGAADRHRLRERLLREARTAARLRDPGIVTVHDLVTDRGLDHVVMELVEGRTLDQVVEQDGPLDERAALAVARGLLAALQVVHAAGVTHRDIKPSNVMLGPDGRVTLTDFGIARAVDDTRMTGTGLVVGSAAYLAPEQLAGGDAAPASDLWALGATLFHAVEGRPAFARDTTAGTVGAVLRGEIPPVRAGGPVAAVVAGLLQRDPAVRLTAAQARAMLGVEPPRPAAATPAPRRVRRWPWAVVAAVLGLAVGAGAALLAPTWIAPQDAVLSYGDGGDMPAVQLNDGYCYLVAPAPGRTIDRGAARSCDQVHVSQVFRILSPYDTTTPDLPLPDAQVLRDYGAQACRLQFDSLVVGPDRDRLAVTALVPSAESFTRDTRSSPESDPAFGRRGVHCLLTAADGSQLTGSRLRTD